MPGIAAFIPFIAGKHIQIGSVQPDAMAEQILKITFDIIRCLGAAQIGLRASRPSLMYRDRAVRQPGGIFLVIGFSIQIIIPVLIMDTE